MLKRVIVNAKGVFGLIFDPNGKEVSLTLEPVLVAFPAGEYTCVRGKHTLKSGNEIETFEITNVPGHTGILFHVGNSVTDTEGCVLLGRNLHSWKLTESQRAFDDFMNRLSGINSFQLTVV